jgi:hypothetical protein
MATRIGLVAQPKRRRGGICRAREQFEPSALFRRARDFCDREHGEWYILSTSHGLVAPQQVIGAQAPHLHTLDARARSTWARSITDRLRERQERSATPLTFVVYASQQYADLLARAAPDLAFERPLAGLPLRERLRWYDDRLRLATRVLSHPLDERFSTKPAYRS